MDLSIRARAAAAIFDMATFGFNPGQKRGPDGRFIKMSGRGSAGPSRKAGERSSDRDVEVVPPPRVEAPPAAVELIAPRTDKRPRTEIYKGRKLRVARHPTRYGLLQTSINGVPVYTPIGTRPEDMDRELMQLRRDIDAADQRRADGEPDAFPAAWYEGAPEPADVAGAPETGPDGKYVKPVKQVATWNGKIETRTSRHPYNYASVVQVGDREPEIVSWHRTRAAAEKGALTKDQRDNGARVVAVAEVKPEQPGENASASAEAQRLDRLVKNATTMYGSDESKWPARAQKDIARLRKKRASMSSDADVFAMPDDLADYWIHGEGAAKVRWCTEGAFERARRALREHVPAPMLDGTVANLYKRACGKWPGQDRD
jgi:hypothetical protein